MVLSQTNPIVKITVALHVGLQTMAYLIYGLVVYYKNATYLEYEATKDSEDDNNKGFLKVGFIQILLDFIPNMMSKASSLLLKIFIKVFRIDNDMLDESMLKHLSIVIAFGFIVLRKIGAFLANAYITRDDDESTHVKALLMFAVFINIQNKFIVNLNKSATKLDYSKQSYIEGVKFLLGFSSYNLSTQSSGKVNTPLKITLLNFIRNRLFVVSIFLTTYSFYLVVYIDENSWKWCSTFKILILTDSLFVFSLVVELSELNISFFNTENTIV